MNVYALEISHWPLPSHNVSL